MSSYLTSDTLISSVKRRASIPTSQVTFEDADFLAFANEELAIGILPAMMQFHEEFLVYSETIALSANTSTYNIPYRAVGNKLRTIFYVDSSGNLQELARILPEDQAYFDNSDATPRAFYLQNNHIVLVPDVGASPTGSLEVSYFLRPNQLVESTRVGTITAINTNTGVITMSTFPTVFAVGSTVDFLETKGGHRTKKLDATITAVNSVSKTITVSTSDIPSDLVVGDLVGLSGETIIPQIPDDLHSVLAQRVACRCLESLGDQQGLAAANVKLQEMELKMGMLIDNRTEGNPQKITNIRGLLRGARVRSR